MFTGPEPGSATVSPWDTDWPRRRSAEKFTAVLLPQRADALLTFVLDVINDRRVQLCLVGPRSCLAETGPLAESARRQFKGERHDLHDAPRLDGAILNGGSRLLLSCNWLPSKSTQF